MAKEKGNQKEEEAGGFRTHQCADVNANEVTTVDATAPVEGEAGKQ